MTKTVERRDDADRTLPGMARATIDMASIPDPPNHESVPTDSSDDFVPPWQSYSDEKIRDTFTERGHSEVERPPESMQEEFTCPDHPPCTDLLRDPAGVLKDEARWPNHLCWPLLCRRSTSEWAFANLGGLAAFDLNAARWMSTFPLPIGRAAIARRLAHPGKEVKVRAPFDGDEEAIWVIHLDDDSGNTTDLFGLGIPQGRRRPITYMLGGLKYVLRGSDTAQFDLVRQAERWWTQLRGEQWRGRPAGSGTWESRAEFWIALRKAVRKARKQDGKVTQEKVAEQLGYEAGYEAGYDARILRRWLKEYNFRWEHVRRIPQDDRTEKN